MVQHMVWLDDKGSSKVYMFRPTPAGLQTVQVHVQPVNICPPFPFSFYLTLLKLGIGDLTQVVDRCV